MKCPEGGLGLRIGAPDAETHLAGAGRSEGGACPCVR